jgi:WD40 repeat protein/DNA-binding CsgD family transcriptional regulator
MNQPAALIEPLNARELKILSLIYEGLSYAEIAQTLYIEKATVTWYVQQIYDKLGLEKSQRNHQKALACASALGLFPNKASSSEQPQTNLSIKNPFKGLRSFQQDEADEFFGREALIQQLLLRFRETGPFTRFLAVVGPSGCGKSSVLRAGLIPALQHSGLEGSEQWVIASMIPGSHPLDELEAALARVSARSGVDIMPQLLRDDRGLQRVVGMLLPENKELLLVVDQFEELFSLVVDENQRRQFLALLSSSVTQLHSRVRVVIALRADYYDRPLMSPAVSELFRIRTEVVAPLTPDELAQAICLPAQQAGVQVESGLVTALVDEVSERPGLLPLMQYSLTELFDQRLDNTMTLAVYHLIGGIRGALTRRADVLYGSLNPSQQALVRQIFLRLVKLGAEGEVLRRRVSRSELDAIENNTQMVDELIDKLVQYRLITLDYDPATATALVEVAHEALIREWDQLSTWVDDCREDIRQQRLLAAAASDWREADRDPSYLLSGTHLVQFQTWAQASQLELGPVESEFLSTSINVKQHQDRRRRLIRNLVFSSVVLVAIVMSVLAFIALDRERLAQDERTRALRRTQENNSIQLANYAQSAYAEGRTDLALLLAMKAIDMTDPPAISDQAFRIIAQGPGIRAVLPAHLNPVLTVAVSPDKKLVLVGGCDNSAWTVTCKKGDVYMLNIGGNASDLAVNPHFKGLDNTEFQGQVNDVVFSPADIDEGGSTALTASEDGRIILWKVSPQLIGAVIRRYDGNAGAVNEVAFSPDGKQFMAGYDRGMIIFWDTTSGREIKRLKGGAGAVTSVAFHGDGLQALSASTDGSTILWDVASKTDIRRYLSRSGVWVTRVAFGPEDKYRKATVWGLGSDNAVHVWDLETAEEIGGIPAGSNPYQDISFTRNGETVALAFEGMIILRDPNQGGKEQRLLQISRSAYAFVTALTISADNSLLVSGDLEGNIELWNLPVRNDLDFEAIDGVTSLGTVALSPDSKYLLSSSGSADTITPTLVKIDLDDNGIDRLPIHLPNQVAPNALAIDPMGHYILVGGGTSAVTDIDVPEEPFLWVLDAENGAVLYKLEGHQHNVEAVAISLDGRYALSGSSTKVVGSIYPTTGELILWDMQSGKQVNRSAYTFDIQGIAFSHDGELAVTCSNESNVHGLVIWELPTFERLNTFPYACRDVAFSPDDQSILFNAMTKFSLNRIYQINASNGVVELVMEGLDSPIMSFDIDLLGRYIFAASQTSAALWDLKSGQELSNFGLPSQGSYAWAVFPRFSDNVIIVQDNTRQLIRWHINVSPTLSNLRIWILKNRYLREFTCEERQLYKNVLPVCDASGNGG